MDLDEKPNCPFKSKRHLKNAYKVILCAGTVAVAVAVGRCYTSLNKIRMATYQGQTIMADATRASLMPTMKDWFNLEEGLTINNSSGKWIPGRNAEQELCKRAQAKGWRLIEQKHEIPPPLMGALLEKSNQMRFLVPWTMPDGQVGALDWTIRTEDTNHLAECVAGTRDFPGVDIPGIKRMDGWIRQLSMVGTDVHIAGYRSAKSFKKVANEIKTTFTDDGWNHSFSITNQVGIWQHFERDMLACEAWAGVASDVSQTYIMVVNYGK